MNADGLSPYTPSLDRIDNAKGYSAENTQVVAWVYNVCKGSGTDKDVLKLAEALCRTADKN